jgi:hypothetical protein
MRISLAVAVFALAAVWTARAADFVEVGRLDEVWQNYAKDGDGCWSASDPAPASERIGAGKAQASSPAAADMEGAEKAFDGNADTKYCTHAPTMWIQYTLDAGRKRVASYAVTSANDVPTRDPKDWRLLGSNDGQKWDELDRREGQEFADRFDRRVFDVKCPGEYSVYRLDVSKNGGDDTSQLAELELIRAGAPSQPVKAVAATSADGWTVLFNGKDLDGWKAAENESSFSVQDGELVVKGTRGHLFYTGSGESPHYRNFHFKAEVMTKPHANSGIYFHTEYQPKDWPRKGYEAQVNNSHSDPKRTASLYDAANNLQSVADDNKWFQYEIIVEGKHVRLIIDGRTITDYTEADNVNFPGWPGRRLSEGTFAIQAHDPGSEVHYRSILVRLLK